MGYTKLFSSIVHSTIWREPAHIRLVWVTMLALADQHGEVQASIPGLADAARVTLQECEAALARLMEPDPYSRSKAEGGRRIETCPGGWRLINHGHYRRLQSEEQRREQAAERKRRQRARERERENEPQVERHAPGHAVSQNVPRVTTTEADQNQIRSRSNKITPAAAADPRLLGPPPTSETGPHPTSETSAAAAAAAAADECPRNLGHALETPVGARSRLVVASPWTADHSAPHRWPEVLRVAQAFHAAYQLAPPKLRSYASDSGVRTIVGLLADTGAEGEPGYTPGYSEPDLLRAIKALAVSDWSNRIRTKGRLPGLSMLTPEVVRTELASQPESQPISPAAAAAIERGRKAMAELDELKGLAS